MRVLLVDDDRELLETLAFSLGRAGWEASVAHDPAAALRQLEAARPQVVVLDVQLGTASGLDLLRELRRQSPLPVVMLTGSANEHVRRRCLELGASRVLEKPISLSHLAAHLRQLVSDVPDGWAAA